MANVLDFGVNGQFPVKVGGLGTTVKYFPRLYGSSANPILGQTPATPSSSSPTGMLALPPQNVFNAQQFDVLATGTFGSDTGDPSGTVLIALYCVTGTASAPVYTELATTTAFVPLLGAPYSWAINAALYGDSKSGVLGGSYTAYINGALNNTTPKTTDNIVSGLDFLNGNSALGGNISISAGNPVCGFVVGVTFGTSNATNTASMYQFTIES